MKPVMLIVLDGWGIGNDPAVDAIAQANIPYYRGLLNTYPHTALEASGESVGLPDGQMGNSEVGHLNLGAGRIVYQDYARINKAIRDGEFFKNPALLKAVEQAREGGKALHLLGLVSDGGVHSHIEHLRALITMAVEQGVQRVVIHAFMDGRDTPPTSGISHIRNIESFLRDKPSAKIATVSGRYWAMDRDKRWKRVERAYRAIVMGEGRQARSALEAIDESYEKDETDEFIQPTVVMAGDSPVATIDDGDTVIFYNFRADRARELTEALTDRAFDSFPRTKVPAIRSYVTMTLYDETFPFPVAFPPSPLKNILGEVLSRNNTRQLRIAETEKYAHVTYFFNSGEEDPFPGEERSLIASPKEVPTYDLKPEMSAYKVTEEVLKRIDSGLYDFILLNFANPDMVGHTGIMEAAVRACEAVDECLRQIVEKVLAVGGVAMITADHGNCEVMGDHTNPHTAHSTNLVPFLLMQKGARLRHRGILADVAPTVLQLMALERPPEMTGESLLRP